jgi:hypothetical protein
MSRFRNILPLQNLMGFETAARLESFSKAAEKLGLTQSAVSHEMRLLEERVGQPTVQSSGTLSAIDRCRTRLSAQCCPLTRTAGSGIPTSGALPQT